MKYNYVLNENNNIIELTSYPFDETLPTIESDINPLRLVCDDYYIENGELKNTGIITESVKKYYEGDRDMLMDAYGRWLERANRGKENLSDDITDWYDDVIDFVEDALINVPDVIKKYI